MDLIAQGKQPHERWRKPLPQEDTVKLGRSSSGWNVPWDPHISAQHVALRLEGDQLRVRRLSMARNPLFVEGQEQQEVTVQPGQHFVVGSTTFTLSAARVAVTLDQPQPDQERQFSADYLRELRYRDAEQRIRVLGQLPEIIQEAPSDIALLLRLTGALFLGVPPADTVAIVKRRDEPNLGGQRHVEVLHWDRKTLSEAEFRPSQRLIESALDQGASILHIWETGAGEAFTQREDHAWAFCTPVPGAACRGWAIYVGGTQGDYTSGRRSDPTTSEEPFRDDLKFTETVAATLGNLRELKQLERTQTTFRQFFSAPVLETFSRRAPEAALAPREADLCVLFCDLRGFTSRSEESSHDLLGLLNQVSSAISIMTRCILDHGGVIGDFQGDSAMGFWGWPLADPQRASRACAAALAICQAFDQLAQHGQGPLAIGIGIASGRGVAGKIGTPDQVKVTVFGPVVNLAARLESMTRKINVPILVDEPTAATIAANEDMRVRKIANIVPFGMTKAVAVGELAAGAKPNSFPGDRQRFRDAAQIMIDGDWPRAATALAALKTDGAAQFLLDIIQHHGGNAPADWDGIIRMQSK